MKKIKIKAFTLIELLIIITILWILIILWFTNFNWYVKNTRDGVRVTDIKTIYDWLNIYKIKTWKTPLPENYIEVTNWSWALTYQGESWIKLLKTVNIKKWWQDPKTKENYIYTTDKNNKKIQIMWYLEADLNEIKYYSYKKIFKQANANNSQIPLKIYTYWDKIWILTDTNKQSINKTITWSIDINSYTWLLITYFWWKIYEWWTSTQTWVTLVNQLESALNNTIPCNSEVYNWYDITSLQDSQLWTFTKTEITNNWIFTKTLTIECKNWELDHINEIENTNLSCNEWYVNNIENNLCIENICKWTMPANSHSTSTNQTVNKSWSYSTIPLECSYECDSNYTWNEISKTCDANTRTNQLCTWLPVSNALWNTRSSINQTWDWMQWQPKLNAHYDEISSTTDCRFKCEIWYSYNSLTNTCDWNVCTIPTTETYNWETYNINWPYTLNHSLNTTKVWTTTFWMSPSNWSMTINVWYSCNAWILINTSTTQWAWICSTWYSFNNNWTSPTCIINSYTLSWSFWIGWAWANVSVCWSNVTADSSWNFSITKNYGTSCSNILATKSWYTCTTSSDWPSSLTTNVSNISWACTPNNCWATTQTINWHTYNVVSFNHWATTTASSTINISNWTRTYSQNFSCSLWVVSISWSETNTSNTCNTWYTWNWSSCNKIVTLSTTKNNPSITTLSNWNLTVYFSNNWWINANIDVSSWKWYWEWTSTSPYDSIWINPSTSTLYYSPWQWWDWYWYIWYEGLKAHNQAWYSWYGTAYWPIYRAWDVIWVLLDMDNKTISFSKNWTNLWVAFSSLPWTSYTPSFWCALYSWWWMTVNFWQSEKIWLQYCPDALWYFKYCPPTWYKAF